MEAYTTHIIDLSLRKGVNFFCFRKPGSDGYSYGCSMKVVQGLSSPGFCIGGFDASREEFLTIKADLSFPELVNISDKKISSKGMTSFVERSTTRAEHLEAVASVIEKIRQGVIEKAVISRTLCGKADFSVSALFDLLCRMYPDAMVFCYYTDETGLWIGATPEMLLSLKGNQGSTMSLAGTRSVGSSEEWDEKNIHEQRIVTDYIVNVLRESGMTVEEGESSVKTAGPVEHIFTPIIFTAKEDGMMLDLLAERLSPTPALGGFPSDRAVEVIKETERHVRGCYGGFIGPVYAADNADLYVNLRSMKISGGRYVIYAGGGITADSDPMEEWRETERKASTLERAIALVSVNKAYQSLP